MTVQEVMDLVAACEKKAAGLHPASQGLVTINCLKMALEALVVADTDAACDPWFDVEQPPQEIPPNYERAAHFALRSFFQGMGF